MRVLTYLLVAVLWAAEPTPKGQSQDWVIIVNKTNKFDSLTPQKVKLIFMKKISRWPWGAEVTPIDLWETSSIRQDFEQRLLGMTVQERAVYWIDQKVTRNVAKPVTVTAVEAAKALVASTAGAIAYIPRNEVDHSVKVLPIE